MLSSPIASYKVSKFTDDEFASDTDPDHDWGRKEKAPSNVPPIWNSASPPNQDFFADWIGGGNASAMPAATSAAAYGGIGYAAPTAAPFANNGAAQDWNAVPASQYKVPTATGRTPFTGKANLDGTVHRQPNVSAPSSSFVNNRAQEEKTAAAPQIKVLKTYGGSSWTGKSNWDGEQKPATEYWKDGDKAEGEKSGGGEKGGSQW